MPNNGDSFDRLNRRSILKGLGAAGTGVGGLGAFSASAAAVDPADYIDLEAVVDDILYLATDAMPDWVQDTISGFLDWVTNNVDAEFRFFPWDFCLGVDYWADGKKLCVNSSDPRNAVSEEPACEQYYYTPEIYKVGFDWTAEDQDFGDWDVVLSHQPWLGFGTDGCLYAGTTDTSIEEIDICAQVDCLYDTNPVETWTYNLAEIAFEMADAAVEEFAKEHGINEWLVWALIVVLAIIIVVAAVAAAVVIGGSGGSALLPAAGSAGAVGAALGSALA